MNFFGHAAVASWRSSEPSFVLGAMLPDFCGMTRAVTVELPEGALSAGVLFHHRTDGVFHDAPAFLELTKSARADLSTRGLRRGSAMAVAHIGVEILLDGVLASEARARDAYLSAISTQAPLARVKWRSPEEARRVSELVTALSARGLSRQHSSPEIVALRVERALRPRPRLALGPSEPAVVAAWADSARRVIAAAADQLVAEIRAGLASELAGPSRWSVE